VQEPHDSGQEDEEDEEGVWYAADGTAMLTVAMYGCYYDELIIYVRVL
jgi:hypothetical protein